MRSRTAPPSPAALLFDALVYDCKDETERNATINKILATTGGSDTVAAASDLAQEKIAELDSVITQLKEKRDELIDRGITKLPVYVLTEHQLKQAISDKDKMLPLFTAVSASLAEAVKAMSGDARKLTAAH